MSYTKTYWVDGVTPLSAANLNKIETGVETASALRTYPTATGTGTAIVLSVPGFDLVNGQAVTFIASGSNSGSNTTININGLGARTLYDQNSIGAAQPFPPNIVAGRAYTVWYSIITNQFYN